MALLSEEARRDIVHQFDLPERKSKITSLLRQNDQLYCVCRSSDSTRFMVACDACEEWYHGDCVNITESDAKSIKRYYCPLCVSTNSSLKRVYKKAKPSQGTSKDKPTKTDRTSRSGRNAKTESSAIESKAKTPTKVPKKETRQSHCTCSGCSVTKDCGNCTSCLQNTKGARGKRTKPCQRRTCVRDKPLPLSGKKDQNLSSSEDSFEKSDSDSVEEESWKPMAVVKKRRYTKRTDAKPKAKKPKKVPVKSTKPKRSLKRKISAETETNSEYVEKVASPKVAPGQCYGPKCTKTARPSSKYCSDVCGIGLAHARLYAVLPPRLQEWIINPSVAQEHNNRDLEEARQKYAKATDESKRLLEEREVLEKHITYVKTLEISPDTCVEEHEEEGTMYCVTCGIEISMKTCLKHMEKCYNKSESQTTFGSTQKTMMEGPQLFCDSFHPTTNLYCKRLKVLCVEHSKEPKVGESEICGSPLVENIYEVGDKFCRIKKKKCNKHFCWEKLRRAGIDLERIRQYLKMDEMLEKESNIKAALANRAGVMGLLLNSAFDHDLHEKIRREDELNAEVLRQKAEEEQKELEAQDRELAERIKGEIEAKKRAASEARKVVSDEKKRLKREAAQERKFEAAEERKRFGVEKPKRCRKKSGKVVEPMPEQKVNLPSKRAKEHKAKEEKSTTENQQTASQLYKKMKTTTQD